MIKLFWILGGSASGKKYFIARILENPKHYGFPDDVRSFWIADGEIRMEDFYGESGALLARWQWGREHVLAQIAEQRPDIEQRLYVVKTSPFIQARRVIKREGHLKWNESQLTREAMDVELLAQGLSMRHRLPIWYIDSTGDM